MQVFRRERVEGPELPGLEIGNVPSVSREGVSPSADHRPPRLRGVPDVGLAR